MAGRFLDSHQAAQRIGIPTATLRYWRTRPHFPQPPFIKYGKLVRYSEEQLDAWIESRRRFPQAA